MRKKIINIAVLFLSLIISVAFFLYLKQKGKLSYRNEEDIEQTEEAKRIEEYNAKLEEARRHYSARIEREKRWHEERAAKFPDEILKPQKVILKKGNLAKRYEELISVLNREPSKTECTLNNSGAIDWPDKPGWRDKEVHEAFKEIYRKFPESEEGKKAVLILAHVFRDLYAYGVNPQYEKDYKESLKQLDELYKKYPDSWVGKYATYWRFISEKYDKNRDEEYNQRLKVLKDIARRVSEQDVENIKRHEESYYSKLGHFNLSQFIDSIEFKHLCRKKRFEEAINKLNQIKENCPECRETSNYDSYINMLRASDCPFSTY